MTTYRTADLTVHHMGHGLELIWEPCRMVSYRASIAISAPSDVPADMVLALLPLECPSHLAAHGDKWREDILALLSVVNDSAKD